MLGKIRDKVVIGQGDCLQLMKKLPDSSINMVLCDLPYGTTACKWDTVIPFEPLWEEYLRVCKDNSAMVFTASMPFTAAMVMSNPSAFKYSWVWEKSKASNFLMAKKQPLRAHEDILVFCNGVPPYFPQMEEGKPFKGEGRSKKGSEWDGVNSVPNPTFRNDNEGTRYPRTVQYFKTAESEGVKSRGLHPTQKPVDLMRYLIRTYTKENDIVLDNCMGSGTTGVACLLENRRFIGMEQNEKYYEIAKKRLLEC